MKLNLFTIITFGFIYCSCQQKDPQVDQILLSTIEFNNELMRKEINNDLVELSEYIVENGEVPEDKVVVSELKLLVVQSNAMYSKLKKGDVPTQNEISTLVKRNDLEHMDFANRYKLKEDSLHVLDAYKQLIQHQQNKMLMQNQINWILISVKDKMRYMSTKVHQHHT